MGNKGTYKILRSKPVLSCLVGIITFLVFLPTLRNEFLIWDDDVYVYENPFIRSFDTTLFKSVFFEFHIANWHPLTWLSHALDYALWGLNPLGHHLTNNILHALNAALVVFLVMRLMEAYNLAEKPLNNRTIGITGAATGLLFGLHPLHVESVAWVAERKDLLCALFFLLAIVKYSHYVTDIRADATRNYSSRFLNGKYLLTIVIFIFALLSKPMAVTLPLVLLILDWYVFKRIQSLKTFWPVFIEKLPFLVLTVISSVLTIMAQLSGGAMRPMEVVPLASRLIVAAGSIISYLMKIVVPINLVPYYPYPKNISFFSPEHIVPFVLVSWITIVCFVVERRQKLWMAVWSYYVTTLVPVLGIVQVGGQSMADRYTYLPSLGPFLVIGIIAAKVYESVTALHRWRGTTKIIVFSIAVAMLVSVFYATVRQIGIWRNNIVFWSYVIDREPKVPVAHNNLGNAYLSMGQPDMAIEQYRATLRLEPDNVYALHNLGFAYASKGQFDMAIKLYRTALNLKPDLVDGYLHLGNAYASKGQFDMAIEQYRAALRLTPDLAGAHIDLGNAFLSMGRLDTAIAQYRIALSLKPNDAEVCNNLGTAYASKGQFDMAIKLYRTALNLKPDLVGAHNNLGITYLKAGFADKARGEFEIVLRIKPDDQIARQMLSSIIAK